MIKKIKYFLTIFPIFLGAYQNDIDTLMIFGNNKTKDHVILREILHPINQPLDSVILKDDINRLYNLGIFSSVDIQFEDNIYKVNLIESFSIIPDLVIDYSEIAKKWSYGLGLAHINFMGLNQQLYFGGAFIGEKWFAISLSNPWIYGDHISLETIFFNRYSDNPFYDYRFNETYFAIKSGFYKGLYNKFEYGLSYYRNKKHTSSELVNQNAPNEKSFYRYGSIEFDYQYDTRNVYRDPTKGILFGINFRYSKSLIEDNTDIANISLSFDKFILLKIKKIHEPVLSYGIYSSFKFPKFSDLPIHEYEYMGGEDYVRGYSSDPYFYPDNFDKNIEVSNIIYNYLELQSTILEKKDYGKVEFGIDGLIFVNSGIGSKTFDKISLNQLLIGYGVGLKFFVTGPPPISIMIGFNPYGQNFVHIED